jgi:hypothetical protein
MDFVSEQESVFLKADSGVFANDDGEKIEWCKLVFANPLTFENHELAYKRDLDFSKLNKGDRLILSLSLEPTNKKSKVIVSNFEKLN